VLNRLAEHAPYREVVRCFGQQPLYVHLANLGGHEARSQCRKSRPIGRPRAIPSRSDSHW
jgi:hypothetical protein